MLRLAAARGLDLVQTARMLAMAHVAGGDAMIACFDAKYHYWFWRPYQAIPLADTDGNPATVADAELAAAAARRRTSPSTRRRTPATAPRSSTRPGRVLRHRQGPVLTRQPRHGDDPRLRAAPRRRRGRRLGARSRRVPFPELRPARLDPRQQGRPLRRRSLLPTARLKQSCLGQGAARTAASCPASRLVLTRVGGFRKRCRPLAPARDAGAVRQARRALR